MSKVAQIGIARYAVGAAVSVRLQGQGHEGVFILFLNASGECIADNWTLTEDEALAFCERQLGIAKDAWTDE